MSYCPEKLIEQAMQVLCETMDPEHEPLYDQLSKYVSVKRTYTFTSLTGDDQPIDITCKPVDVMNDTFRKYVCDTLEGRVGHPADLISLTAKTDDIENDDHFYYILNPIESRPKWKTYAVKGIASSCFSIPYNADIDEVDVDDDGIPTTDEDFPIVCNWNDIEKVLCGNGLDIEHEEEPELVNWVCHSDIEENMEPSTEYDYVGMANHTPVNVERYKNWDYNA